MTTYAEGTGGLLSQTFVHLRGIGAQTEQRLWHSGVSSWTALREDAFARRAGLAQALELSEQALDAGDLDFFHRTLPSPARWRTFTDFNNRFVAVDIETTGMSVYDRITVIGTEVAGEYQSFVRGSNLDDAADLLSQAAGLITFNGALFDLPFIRRTFPGLKLPEAHLDLRFLARRVGLAGPLKAVERLTELRRGRELDDISGYGATVLWGDYEHDGAVRALARLVSYNAADTTVLRPLAELVVARLRRELEHARRMPLHGPVLFNPDADLSAPIARVRAPRPPRVRASASPRCLTVGQVTLVLPEHKPVRPEVTLAGLVARMRDPHSRIVGIDLTGSAERPTGWALLEGDYVVTGTLGTTDEIVERTLACRPRLVSIDSPLSLPVGRDCTDDDCACRPVGGITRHCERELKRRGVNVYPCLIRSMQALTRRGIAIAERFRGEGVEVIESFPGAAQDIMRIPRKRASQHHLRDGLERFGVNGIRPAGQLNHDELDAITSALVGSFYLADLYEPLGDEAEQYLIVPSLNDLPSDADAPAPEPAQPVSLMLIGAGAVGAAAMLPDDVHLARSPDDYWKALAERGPTLRAARVDARAERLPRRPVFADVHLREDDELLRRRLRGWHRSWRMRKT